MLRRRDKRRYLAITIDKDQLLDTLTALQYQSAAVPNAKKLTDYGKRFSTPKNRIYDPKLKFLLKLIKRRYSELFGFIDLEKSGIQIITGKKIRFEGVVILRCHLDSIDHLLFTIATFNKPKITTLKMSGTIRKLISEIDPIIILFNST